MMKPYWVVFAGTLQRALIYRARIFTYAFITTFSPLLMIIVWTGYYQTGKSVGGFSYSQLISYYLAVTAVTLAASRAHTNMTDDIKDGELVNYVIKPFSYYFFRLAWELGWHTVKFLTFGSALLVLVWFFRLPIVFSGTPFNITLAVLSFLLSYLLSFSFSLLIGSVAFFITETTGVTNLFEVFSDLATGKIFPLTFFPIMAQKVIHLTPFASMVYFPAQVILGNLRIEDVFYGLVIQVIWIMVIGSGYLLMWRAGIKKFSGVGL